MLALPGIRAIAFGLENVLLTGPSQGTDTTQSGVFERVIYAPKSEPLAPLFRNVPLKREEAARLLGPFFGAETVDPAQTKAFFENHVGVHGMASWIASLMEADLQVVVWDHCLPGLTQRVHNLLDTHYPQLFPRPMRLLSTRHGFQLGDEASYDLLWTVLRTGPDDLLVITSNRAQRDFAVRHGLQCFFYDARHDDGTVPIDSALRVYLGSDSNRNPQVPIKDPAAYMTAVARLCETSFHRPEFREILTEITMNQTRGPLEADFRCLLIDRKLQALAGTASPPRFKPAEEIFSDAAVLVEDYLAQTERGLPMLARAAMMGLMQEMTSLCRMTDFSHDDIEVICGWVRKINRHIAENRGLYVDRALVFHEDEWETLVRMATDDDAALDRRYADWVDDTYRHMREMAARKEPTKAIRTLVKERLVEDLVLGMLELEMMKRSLESGRRRHSSFPRHHDAKNRVASLTANINDKEAWIKTAALHTESLQGWVRGLTLRLVRFAGENKTRLAFQSEMDAGLPMMELADFNEAQREALDHLLTELIRNAVKYRNPAVDSRVTVFMAEGDESVIFRVVDNGLGIRDIEAVLEGGVREHPEIREGYGGGLASVLQHVRSQRWDFHLESEPARGTTAELVIPLSGPDSRRQRLTRSGFPIS